MNCKFQTEKCLFAGLGYFLEQSKKKYVTLSCQLKLHPVKTFLFFFSRQCTRSVSPSSSRCGVLVFSPTLCYVPEQLHAVPESTKW